MNYAKLLLHKFMGVDIIKVFSLNALATFVRMLAGMISVKVVALIIGPAGIALLGQLGNIGGIIQGMANGGINTGITKYVAEFKDDDQQVKVYISNAFRITIICSFFVGLSLIILCVYLSRLLLLTDEYYYVFIVFGFTIVLFALNNFLISILNGYKNFKLYVRVNVFGTIVGLFYSIILIYIWELPGAMINAVTFQSIMLFATFYLCRKLPWMNLQYFKQKWDRVAVKNYFGYSLMTFTTLALFPTSQILLRGYVISEISAAEAGIWEGMNRLSNMYLSVITSAFTIYYLPRLSEISDPRELHSEIFRCYKIFIPILVILCLVIFYSKHFILWLLFSPDFYSMEILFAWQLVGDFFKICSYILAMQMLAKARTRLFISTETIFTLSYFLICYFLVHMNGIVGLSQGYMLNFILYMLTMAILFRKVLIPHNS